MEWQWDRQLNRSRRRVLQSAKGTQRKGGDSAVLDAENRGSNNREKARETGPPKWKSKSSPPAIIVKANEGVTYAEVLRKVKENSKDCFQGVEVTAARKTAAGFLLLEFVREENKEKLNKVREDMARVMVAAASVAHINKKKKEEGIGLLALRWKSLRC